MGGKLGIERLFGWTRSRREADPVDAADVGTAYGMELSIENVRKTDDGATPSSVAPSPPPATQVVRRKPR
jgi:hypothetical protein